jgi:glucose/mannose transport system permease protein
VVEVTRTETAGARAFGRVMLYALLILFALYYLMPLFVMLTTSLKTLDDIRGGNLLSLPAQISFDAWIKAWSSACTGINCGGLSRNFWNSVSFVLPAVAISTLIGALNGYVLTMWRFRGSDALFTLLLIGCFIPFQVVLLPMAQTLGWLGIANSTTGLIFVHVVYGLAFTTLFFRNFYVSIPEEMVKAARIDGAGFFRIFWRIILPLSPPILIVTVIFQFTGIWNEFLYGVTFTTGDQQPVTAALIALSAAITSEPMFGDQSAAVLIAALPTLLVYLFGGRYFLRGLTAGAVK